MTHLTNNFLSKFEGKNFDAWQFTLYTFLKANKTYYTLTFDSLNDYFASTATPSSSSTNSNTTLSIKTESEDDPKQKGKEPAVATPAKSIKTIDSVTEDFISALATITLAIDLNHNALIRHAKTPKEAMRILCDRYKPDTELHQLILLDRLFNLRFKDSQDIMQYLSDFDFVTAELEQRQVNFEQMMAYLLLRSFPPSLAHIRQIIEHSTEKFTLQRVKFALSKEGEKQFEKRHFKTVVPIYTDIALTANYTGTCAYCKEPGHHISNCKVRPPKKHYQSSSTKSRISFSDQKSSSPSSSQSYQRNNSSSSSHQHPQSP